MSDWKEINKQNYKNVEISIQEFIQKKWKNFDIDSLIKNLQQDLSHANNTGNQLLAFQISKDLCTLLSHDFNTKNNVFYKK